MSNLTNLLINIYGHDIQSLYIYIYIYYLPTYQPTYLPTDLPTCLTAYLACYQIIYLCKYSVSSKLLIIHQLPCGNLIGYIM